MRRPSSATVLIVTSLALIAFATLTPSEADQSTQHLCIICGTYGGVDAFLNVMLFVPLGIGLALGAVRPGPAVVSVVGVTLFIELAQFQLIAGRDASVGDILMNSLGGTAGYALGRHRHRLLAPGPHAAIALVLIALLCWLGVQALVAYSFTPAMPAPPYFAQIDRPASPTRPAFPGRVLGAWIGERQLAPGLLADGDSIRQHLAGRSGASVSATVVEGGHPQGKAEIVVLSGQHMVAAASLEQLRADFVFGVRTGAELLRLRPYEYRMRRAFLDGRAFRGTLTLSGRFCTSKARLEVIRENSREIQEFVPRLSQGWMLVTPVRLYVDDDTAEYVMAAAYLALLMFPTGLWAYCSL
ncbi:MAG TPA: VanZ family protein, partial [Gemmatimonadaceae bacterium]|nr:VanZ family protein [Gemmatimonadaceae bacterium]